MCNVQKTDEVKTGCSVNSVERSGRGGWDGMGWDEMR